MYNLNGICKYCGCKIDSRYEACGEHSHLIVNYSYLKKKRRLIRRQNKKKYGKQKYKKEKSYSTWRYKCLKRDNFKCRKCGSKEKLHVHHKKPKKDYPELILVVKNGITLCEDCHDVKHDGLVSFLKEKKQFEDEYKAIVS